MSPKKKTRKPRPRTVRRDAPARAGVVRTPVVVEEPPPRWPLLVWAALVVVWVLGSLATFMRVLAAAGMTPEELTDEVRAQAAWALLWLLVFALGTPLAGAVWAALLRRRVAAALFGCALAGSAVLLWLIAPPGEVWAALRAGLAL
ncbi:hypothetical protein [Thermobifida cellulosilytica]|uniref:Uncharacterized protein n=1 Tax=Thermobifida cellulosilytica TB100 TaxID=665004 RepID=A0A147KHZ6_THECS|nr:hypothetical protein [Thermobifida cellulosilytica]KUP96901.1 hypothetical protein AC529_09795 [Thermobifida cellulosilytica TB100]